MTGIGEQTQHVPSLVIHGMCDCGAPSGLEDSALIPYLLVENAVLGEHDS